MIAAAGVAWGIYDTLKNQNAATAPGGSRVPGGSTVHWGVPPVPRFRRCQAVPTMPRGAVEAALDPLARIIRLAVSAARADGQLTDQERAMIIGARARGRARSRSSRPSSTRRVRSPTSSAASPTRRSRRISTCWPFAIVRADETVSGAERIYLAQLAHQLGLDRRGGRRRLETETGDQDRCD